jgi:hypothetical protein
MSAVVASMLLLVACIGFYHARSARTRFDALRQSARRRISLRWICWALLVLSAWLFALPQGWERGVPIWLGTLSLAGIVSLLLVTLAPRWHGPCALVGLGVALICGLAMIAGTA